MPSLPALNQQRAKLKPEALEAVLAGFNDSVSRQAAFPTAHDGYRCLAAAGSTTIFSAARSWLPPEYFCSPGHSASGVYSIHINAFFDLDAHIYTDAILQPVHEKTNSAHSATSWTGMGRSPAGRTSTLATGATAPTTTWHM